jgi:RHS repeat-associated protein
LAAVARSRDQFFRDALGPVALVAAGATLFSLTVVVAPDEVGHGRSALSAAAVSDAANPTAAALRAARASGRPVEIASATTAYSITTANPDGTLTTTLDGSPTRAFRNGRWVPLDATLKSGTAKVPLGRVKGKGTNPSRVAVFAPKVSDQRVYISAGDERSDDAPLASVGTTAGQALSLDWPTTLPAPDVSGPTATYDVTGPESVTVTALDSGFDAHVVLPSRPSKTPVYRFPLTTTGVRFVDEGNGAYAAVDKAGKEIFQIPTPVGWDSSPLADPDTGPLQVQLNSSLVTDSTGGQVLEIRPSDQWLAGAVYPVVIDPVVIAQVGITQDTYVKENAPTSNFEHDADLRVGYTTNAKRQRAFVQFNIPVAVQFRTVLSSGLTLREWDALSCNASPVNVYPINEAWSTNITWANTSPVGGPTVNSTPVATKSFVHGYGSCTNGTSGNASETIEVKNIVQQWVDTTIPNKGFGLFAGNESDTTQGQYKGFCSFNTGTTGACADPSYQPKLSITYDSYPVLPGNLFVEPASNTTDSCPTGTNGPFANSLAPLLRATADDIDNDQVKMNYEVRKSGTTTVIASGTTAFLPPNAEQRWRIPDNLLVDGTRYEWRAQGDDGGSKDVNGNQVDGKGYWSDFGASWCSFAVDIKPPPAPSVTSTVYPAGAWSKAAKTLGLFTIGTTADVAGTGGLASGLSGIVWSLDDPTPATSQGLNASGGIDPISITPDTDVPHTVYVAEVDKAGNRSSVTSYQFNVGNGGLTSPADGDRTARRFHLAAKVKDATAVDIEYRRGGTTDTAGWTAVPAGTGLPVTSGAIAPFDWDVLSTLGTDGAIDLRVKLTGGSAPGWTSEPISVTLDQLGSDAATQSVGPGTLNLLTGDYTISATEADFFGVSVSRTARSRDSQSGTHVAGVVAPFGPQWAAGGVSAASDFTTLTQSSPTTVELVRADATRVQFTYRDADDGGGLRWVPEVGSEDLTLAYQANDPNAPLKAGSSTDHMDSFTLKDTNGTAVVFVGDAASGLFTIYSATPTGQDNDARYLYGSDGAGKLRLIRIIAPNASISDLGTCDVSGAAPAGCRRLDLTYATTTTATSTVPGDYAGRVSEIRLKVTDPGDGAAKDYPVARYSYDDQGHLVASWDPRIVPALKTTYGYTSDRVTSMTPPGERGWTFAYGAANGDTNTGRLFSVTRPYADASGNTVWNVAYGVPLSSFDSRPAMDAAGVAGWGQVSVPTDATAVLPPDVSYSNSSHNGSSGVTGRATITYLDVEGRKVNVATPGGGITSTDYDDFGNVIRELTADNRARAIDTTTSGPSAAELSDLGLLKLTATQRAELLATTSVYSPDGKRLMETFGPIHRVVTGTTPGPVPARTHTVNSYDKDRPSNAVVSDQITGTIVGARAIGAAADVDQRETRTEYDWARGKPNKTIVDPTGKNIQTVTAYDDQARPTRVDMPSAVSVPRNNGADSTITVYYGASQPAPCNDAVQDGMVCQVKPAGAIANGGSNPTQRVTTTTTYTALGKVKKVTDVANGSTRATTTTYETNTVDGASVDSGRVASVSTTGGVGTAVPNIATGYSTTTGRVLTTTDTTASPNRVITRAYDLLGRMTSYTDADLGRTDTTWTSLDQIASTRQYANNVALAAAATTYSYSSGRQLLASITDPVTTVSGAAQTTFASTYDVDGNVVTQTMPGGVTMTRTQDPTGSWTALAYTTGSGSTLTTLYAETVVENAHGQWITRTRGDSGVHGTTQTYGYDKAGRLSSVLDATINSCTRRDYGYDLNSNRISFNQGSAGTCPTTPQGTTVTTGYDTADRLINGASVVYDAFGRTTTTPLTTAPTAADGTGATVKTATLAYFNNDLVQSETIAGTGTQSWTLDPNLRLSGFTGTIAKTNHYSGDSDSPAWINETSTAVTRNIVAITGDFAATSDATGNGARTLRLPTLHGDVAQALGVTASNVLDPSAGSTTITDADEFGNLKNPAARYDWLGAKQRSTETVGNAVVVMGVRLYNPAYGRFLSTDPVPGGSANSYDYCNQDPLNCFDLSGLWWSWKKAVNIGAMALGGAALLGCFLCGGVMAAYGVYSAYQSFRGGDKIMGYYNALSVLSFGYGGYLRYANRMAIMGYRAMGPWAGYRLSSLDARRMVAVSRQAARWSIFDRYWFGVGGLLTGAADTWAA